MKIMMTKESWLKMLPSPYREEALENLYKSDYIPFKSYPTLREALAFSFSWVGSPQGIDYWNDLYCKLLDEQFFHNNIKTDGPGDEN